MSNPEGNPENLRRDGAKRTSRVPQIFFSTREVADMFGVAQSTVSTWIKKGKIKGHKLFGLRWRIHYQQLVDALDLDPEQDQEEIESIKNIERLPEEGREKSLERMVREAAERKQVEDRNKKG